MVSSFHSVTMNLAFFLKYIIDSVIVAPQFTKRLKRDFDKSDPKLWKPITYREKKAVSVGSFKTKNPNHHSAFCTTKIIGATN